MFSIYITKKSIVLQPSQQALLQQDCRATFSGPSPSRKQSQASRVHPFHFSLFYTQSINNDTNYTKDELQLAQFLCFIPTYFQEMYRVTVTTTEIIQHKPTYHSSGRRFSGSGFSGSFLIFLVLVLLVIDGFDDSGFAGFSLLVLLVLALLVLGGGFSGFSSSSGSSSKSNRNLRGQRHNLSISLFSLFSLYSINHQRCKSYKGRRCQQQQPFFSILQPREFLRLHHQGEYILTATAITTNNIQQKGSGKSKKRAVTWMLRREESGCFLLAHGMTKDFVYLVYSKNALLGVFGIATQIDYSS